VTGYAFVYPSEFSPYFISLHFGHWCVVLVSPIVWYPFAIAAQRYWDIAPAAPRD